MESIYKLEIDLNFSLIRMVPIFFLFIYLFAYLKVGTVKAIEHDANGAQISAQQSPIPFQCTGIIKFNLKQLYVVCVVAL